MKKLIQDMNWIYWAGWSWFRAVAKASFNYEVVHRERLIEDGGALLVCNHGSFLDPPLVGIAHRNGVYFLARKTLFRGFCAWLYPRWNSVPIDQENPDMSSLKKVIKLLKSGERVVMFPEGERSWDGEVLEAKAGVGLIVSKAQVPVLPMRLFGAFEALPRGKSLWKHRQVTLVVGEPIAFSEEEKKGKGRGTYQAIADRIMKEIAAIELPERH
jgi:1-acyl-sn-glycerol-3-phosphate acyltransferase